MCLNCILWYMIYQCFSDDIRSGEPGLVDMVLALHAGSRGFDSHRGHMSKRFSQWALSWKIVVSEWRLVIAVSLNIGGGVHLIKAAKLCMCTQNTTNTTRTNTPRQLCAAMVPYRWATRGTSLRELEYTHSVFEIPRADFSYQIQTGNEEIKKSRMLWL